MKKQLFLIFVLLVLAACSNETATTETAQLDPADLPLNVNIETVANFQSHKDVVLIDVREQWEYDEAHIPGVTLIPMSEIEARVSEIPRDKEVILTCRSGNRSSQVLSYLQGQGFDNVHNMEGGIVAWQAAGLAVE
jgi:phage shock protein E